LNLPGVSNARNFLIENSSEQYICFVDDDDFLSLNFLESLLSVSSEVIVGITDVQVFKYSTNDSEKNYIGNSYSKLSSAESSKFKARKYFSSPWAKIISRKVIGSTRFDVNLSKGEDALFMTQLSPRVHQVRKAEPEACYYVYLRPGSATRSNISKILEIKRIFYVLKQYSRLLGDHRYEKMFLATRILATLLHLKKLFSLN
jgi:glycosyltransferase involved in cell wall biosynthesis